MGGLLAHTPKLHFKLEYGLTDESHVVKFVHMFYYRVFTEVEKPM